MKIRNKKVPLEGYMVLPYNKNDCYRGVDRKPFEPKISFDEIDTDANIENENDIWSLYPSGWKQDAYRLYEKNLVEDWGNDYLLKDYITAKNISHIIEPFIGKHDIIKCSIFDINNSLLQIENNNNYEGYDIAYPGGDYYSAIYNGLIFNGGHPDLNNAYKQNLNEFGLFKSNMFIAQFLQMFKKIVKSESNSNFCIYKISLL